LALFVFGVIIYYGNNLVSSWFQTPAFKRLLNRNKRKYQHNHLIVKSFRTMISFVYTVCKFVARMTYWVFFFHLATIPLLLILVFVIYCIFYPGNSVEPFSLTEGISIWPTELLRLAAVFMCLVLLRRGWTHMRDNGKKIESCLEIPVIKLEKNVARFKPEDIRHIWNDYCCRERNRNRMKRLWLPGLIWLIICGLLFLVQSANVPFRGEVAHTADMLISLLAVISFIMLFMFVIDVAQQGYNFIKQLIEHDTFWPVFMDTKDQTANHYSLIQRIKREWHTIQMIAMRTEDISATVYHPIIIVLLLLAAQNDYFDNWDMPFSLMLIASVNIGITLCYAIALRRVTINAKRISLEKLREIRAEALDNKQASDRDITIEKLNFYEDQIRRESRGTFSPISQQPWLRAFTLFGGGGSGLLLIEYLSRVN